MSDPRIETRALFPELLAGLLELLRGLQPDDWDELTVAGSWTVKDVASHLLGGELGILSRRRDGWTPGSPPRSYAELVALIDGLNRSWVEAARRLSPALLVDLLEHAGRQSCLWFASLDPDAPGDPVDWAAPGPAPVWMELAREYTERWHHQQQIRDAVGRPGLDGPRHLGPALDAFVRGVPRALERAPRPDGTALCFTVTGSLDASWCFRREGGAWRLVAGAELPAARLTLPADVAWRLFCKGVTPEAAEREARLEGDIGLCRVALGTVSILG
jgi:uncharacterized protein (TIGR03083 family)